MSLWRRWVLPTRRCRATNADMEVLQVVCRWGWGSLTARLYIYIALVPFFPCLFKWRHNRDQNRPPLFCCLVVLNASVRIFLLFRSLAGFSWTEGQRVSKVYVSQFLLKDSFYLLVQRQISLLISTPVHQKLNSDFFVWNTHKKNTQSAAPHVRNVRNVFLLGGSRGIPKIVVIDVMTSCRSL